MYENNNEEGVKKCRGKIEKLLAWYPNFDELRKLCAEWGYDDVRL
jgi:hypothetical protein